MTNARKTILYTISGGFISVAFGVLGATAAQAGPRVPVDAGGGGKPATATPAGPPKQDVRQADREQADRETRKFERQANEGKAEQQKQQQERKDESRKAEDRETRKFEREAGPSPDREKDRKRQDEARQDEDREGRKHQREADNAREQNQQRAQAEDRENRKFEREAGEAEAQRDRERAAEQRQDDDRETRKFQRQADQARQENDAQDQADRENRKFEREIDEDKERRSQDISAVAEQNRKDRARDESLRDYMRGSYSAAEQNRQDRAADERKKNPVRGLRAIELNDEIERTAGPARIEADDWAERRDQGVTGSVRAYETTERFAAEAEADAQWRERLRDFGKPKPTPVGRYPKTIDLDEPISGLRALEVKDEITKSVDPAKERAATLKKLRDDSAGPEREELAAEYKIASREAKRLEFLDDAGKSIGEKTQDSVNEDLGDLVKVALAAGDLATDVWGDQQARLSEKKVTAAQGNARQAARDLTSARTAARLPDGTIDPAKQEELNQKRAALRAALNDATTASADHRLKLKNLKAIGNVGGGALSGAGVIYDIESGKAPDDAIVGAVGGVVGGALGGALGSSFGPAAPVAAPLLGLGGGFYGSAFVENAYTGIKDSINDTDINDAVNEGD